MWTIFSDLYLFVFRYTHLIVNKYYRVVNQDMFEKYNRIMPHFYRSPLFLDRYFANKNADLSIKCKRMKIP